MDIKKFLQSEYNYENFKQFIFDKFYGFEENNTNYEEPETNTEQKHILKYKFLGSCDLDDKKEIGFFEVITTEKTDIENNRVSLGNILKSKASNELLDGAIAVFYNPKNPSVWRLSFIKFSYDENDKQNVSNLKRFTYVLGEHIPIKTAYNQLKDLKYPSLVELEDAFSVEKISKEFFTKYKELYHQLVNDITVANGKANKSVEDENNHNKSFEYINDKKVISFYIKKLLGRIVFLYFVQKKGWLNNDRKFLSNLFHSYTKENPNINFYDEILEDLFFNALNTKRDNDKINLGGKDYEIPYLNGGLFEEDEYDKTDLTITNEDLRQVLELFDSYNFTVIEDTPHDSEIAIDPEMLGRVFEDLLEDRKEKGAFYTPREIVHYMCQQSIMNYLLNFYGEDSLEDIKSLVIEEKTDSKFIKNNAKDIKKYLEDIKVLDPAIGSGAFPMGMLHEIVSILSNLDKTADIGQLKRKVIENSIYGVDIEHSAVEIAKLRFWLSIVVDEEKPTPLPNLSYKIMVGNSLIETINGFDPLEISKNNKGNGERIKRMKDKFHSFYNASSNEEKNNIKKDIENDVDDIFGVALRNYQKELEIIISRNDLFNTNPKLQKEHEEQLQNVSLIKKILKDYKNDRFTTELFLYKIYFAEVLENGGFDIIIGNPPYVSAVSMARTDKVKDNFRNLYPLATGTYDLYILFLLKATELLNNQGIYSWIIPNKFLIADYAKNTLKFLKDNGLLYAVEVSKFNVFKSASVYPIILLGNKNIKNTKFKEYLLEKYTDLLIQKFIEPIRLDKFKTIKDFGIKIGSGATGFEAQKIKEFVSEVSTDNSIPFTVSGCIDRYIYSNKNVRFMGLKLNNAYIEKSDTIAESKWNFWTNKKIVVAGMTKELEAVYVEEPLALGVGVYAIYDFKEFNPKFLTAILNSKYLTFYFVNKFRHKHLAGGYLAINKSTIEELPLVYSDKQIIFEIIVDYINFLKFDDKYNYMRDFFEKVIDVAVYELYFEEEVHSKGFGIIEVLESELVPFDNCFETIERVYKKLSDKNHKVAYNVNFIDTLDIVKTIENK